MQQNLLTTPKPKTWLQTAIERNEGKAIDELLREMYVEQGMTLHAMSGLLGVNAGALSRWMDDFGIPRRPRGRKAA